MKKLLKATTALVSILSLVQPALVVGARAGSGPNRLGYRLGANRFNCRGR